MRLGITFPFSSKFLRFDIEHAIKLFKRSLDYDNQKMFLSSFCRVSQVDERPQMRRIVDNLMQIK